MVARKRIDGSMVIGVGKREARLIPNTRELEGGEMSMGCVLFWIKFDVV